MNTQKKYLKIKNISLFKILWINFWKIYVQIIVKCFYCRWIIYKKYIYDVKISGCFWFNSVKNIIYLVAF